MSLGALEPKFWQAWCRGVGREDLIASQFDRPGSPAHEQVSEIFRGRSRENGSGSRANTTAVLSRSSSSTRRWTPSSCAAAGWSSRSTSPELEQPIRQLGIPIKLERTPGEHARLPGPALGEHTAEVLLAAGYSEDEVAELISSGAAAGPADAPQGSFMGS